MSRSVKLPTSFVGNRIFVHPITDDGVRLIFYTDTGGGGMFIEPDTVKRLGLQVARRTENNTECELVTFPQFRADALIPSGMKSNELLLFSVLNGSSSPEGWDGFLGQSWFADRVWNFDFIDQQLAYLDEEDTSLFLSKHSCSVGFLINDGGERPSNFPRIQATIDGEILDFLFDTGAMTFITDDALNLYFNDGDPAIRATSFITHSVFESWRARHPNWLIIDNADGIMNESMIQVPIVRIAGYDVGPVWFTRRPDHNFHNYMSQWMDRRVDGALGGSLFKYFSITIDYPNSVAYFKC